MFYYDRHLGCHRDPFFFCNKAVSVRVASSILQKVEPKFLITDGDRAGGETVQPRQFLEVHLGFLKPFFCKITLLLLLLAGSSRTELASLLLPYPGNFLTMALLKERFSV